MTGAELTKEEKSLIWIILPLFNEQSILAQTLTSLTAHYPNIIVVDDGSSDQSYSIAAQFPVHLLRHELNLGQGMAIKTGLEYALQKGAKVLVTFDADGQMDFRDINQMCRPILENSADIVFGKRFGSELNTGIPFFRKCAIKMGIIIFNFLYGTKFSDVHNGFRAISEKAAKSINITQARMAHASEIVHKTLHHRLRWVEVPVHIVYTDYSIKKGQKLSNAINVLMDLIFPF